MKRKRILQVITAVPLITFASFALIFEADAHVSMCMTCAIGYSLGLLINKSKKFTSFFSGGILFYTIYAASTIMFLSWLGILEDEPMPEGLLIADPAWLYHFFINLALLVMFYTIRDRVEYILTGIEVFMITSPVMILLKELFGRELWGDTNRIILYATIGLALFIIHRLVSWLGKKSYPLVLLAIRKLIIVSLFVYAILLIIAVPIVKPTEAPVQEEDHTQTEVQQEVLEWVEDSFTQPLPANASKTRLSLPGNMDDFMPNGIPITGFGAHVGQHIEGMDHSWIPVKMGVPAKSWADGEVAFIQKNMDEYFIYLDYGHGLTCAFAEIKTPLVDEGQKVKHLDPIGVVNEMWNSQAGEIETYCADANRTDGIKPSVGGNQQGSAVSPFDYLNENDKQLLIEEYSKVITPYLEQETVGEAWSPADPFLTAKLMIHEKNQIIGEWFLINKEWNGNDLSLITFHDTNNYYNKKVARARAENATLIASTYMDGTYEVTSYENPGTALYHEEKGGKTYYLLFEIIENAGVDSTGTKRAQMRFEMSETPISFFSENALMYQERGVFNPRYDAWKLGDWVHYQ